MTPKPTHTERKRCELSTRELADFMAASSQSKRSVLRAAKFRPIARLVQHKEARVTIAAWFKDGQGDTSALRERAEWFRSRMTTTDFESDQNQYNADYVESFADVREKILLPSCNIDFPQARKEINLNSTTVTFFPDITLSRINRRNNAKSGALFLRYSKQREMDNKAAEFQSAFIFGFLERNPEPENSTPESSLCLTVCAYSGNMTPAPTKAVYLFNEMAAACASIAEQWPNLKPPPNAVLK